jgi:hypothetical protein
METIKNYLKTTAKVLCLVVIIISVGATFLVIPSHNKSARWKYNDGNDYAISHMINEKGLQECFKDQPILLPGQLCYAAFDKKWDGRLDHWGLVAFVLFTGLTIMFFLLSKKHIVGDILNIALALYFAVVLVSIFTQGGIIDNQYRW